MFKMIFAGVSFVVVLAFCVLTMRYGNLYVENFFGPKEQSIQRQVFEETKSYVHGSIQDIAKYYGEYSKADTQSKEIIANVIKQRFAEFDPKKIQSLALRQWFVAMRGY